VTRIVKLVVAAGAAALVLVVAAVGVVLAVRAHRAKGPGAGTEQHPAAQAITLGEVPEAAFWIDVHTPAVAWKAARESAWLKKAMAEPLGQGVSSGLAAFLGTRGTDLAGAFEGTVLDLVMAKLLADPFRVTYVAGADATGVPAFLVPKPSSAARGAFELLEGATQHGRYQLAACPGGKGSAIEVSRWLVADHAVFAGEFDGRIALAGNPKAVAQVLCLSLPEMKAEKGVDVTVTVSREGLGHEANLGAELLGVSDVTTFQFGIEGTQLVPRGIAGKLEQPKRLEAAAPKDELLKLVPGDAGFVLVATLNLPEPLDAGALQQHLDGKYQGKLSPRTVAVVWNPRPGDPEVAVAWPDRDAKFLKSAFGGGPSKIFEKQACGHVLLASSGALASTMERACGGKIPSLLNGAPAVVAGLKQPVSLGVNVNVGQVLSRALGDAWAAEHGKGPGSPEIESARRLLEELPFMGLRGVTKGDALEPGGFRS
jgi:hypothetical protein